jgi:hypothetical protein
MVQAILSTVREFRTINTVRRQHRFMKSDPVVGVIAFLALIQILVILNTVMPISSAKATFYSVAPEMIKIEDSSGEVERVKKSDTIYVRGDLLHKNEIRLASSNLCILLVAAIWRWFKLKNAEPNAPPNSRPPRQFSASPDTPTHDSQRASSSGGCG